MHYVDSSLQWNCREPLSLTIFSVFWPRLVVINPTVIFGLALFSWRYNCVNNCWYIASIDEQQSPEAVKQIKLYFETKNKITTQLDCNEFSATSSCPLSSIKCYSSEVMSWQLLKCFMLGPFHKLPFFKQLWEWTVIKWETTWVLLVLLAMLRISVLLRWVWTEWWKEVMLVSISGRASPNDSTNTSE